MSVSFNEENTPLSARRPVPQPTALARLIMKTGLAKSEKQAQVVMLIIAIVAIALTIFIII